MTTSRSGSMLGPYLLGDLLGRGGMGEVYRATDTRRTREVALKLLGPAVTDSPEARERFLRESRIAAVLNDPHVIPIHDWGEIDGQLFIDMRLVQGRDLRKALTEDGPMPAARALEIVGQAARALDSAHAAGLVHRDVKPENLLVDNRDFTYLVDFGVAVSSTDTRLTQTGSAIGSLRYMAPERFGVDAPTSSVDIYALTCVLYECLTGNPPFADATTLQSTIAAHLHRTPPSVGGPIDAVIARGMAKQPEQRFPTATALVDAARQALTGLGTTPTTHAPTAVAPAPVAVSTPVAVASTRQATPLQGAPYPTPQTPPSSPSKSKIVPLLLGGGALLVIGGLVAALLLKSTGPESTAAPTTILAPTTVTSHTTAEPETTTVTESAVPDRADATPSSSEKAVWNKAFGDARVTVYLSTSGYNRAIVTSSGGLPGQVRVWSPSSGWEESPHYTSAPSAFTSPEVYAPGDTCIRVVAIYGGQTLNQKIC